MVAQMTQKTMLKALKHTAKRLSVKDYDVQCHIRINDQDVVYYNVILKDGTEEIVTFDELCGLSFDPLNKAALTQQFIEQKFSKWAQIEGCNKTCFSLIITLIKGKDKPMIFVKKMDKTISINQISFDEIFE